MFPQEHPTYILRRLEAQNTRLRKLAKELDQVDLSDPEAMRKTLHTISTGMAEIATATGSLAGWIGRMR
jgi:hypothetical protein